LVGILDNWAFAGNASRANDSRIEEIILIAVAFIVSPLLCYQLK
jgi:hypothetical protein